MKIYDWICKNNKQIKDSFIFAMTIIGVVSTICGVIGVSLGDICDANIWQRILILLAILIVLVVLKYDYIKYKYNNIIKLNISYTNIEISYNDIFKMPGMRVIGCDTHFDTRIDDNVIAKSSLHGKLFLSYGEINEIKAAIENSASRMGLKKSAEGLYNFPLGTIIRYDSSVDGQTYLMLAVTELDQENRAHTNMAQYEHMLMTMWKEIQRVYANNDVVIPIIGAGILRFDDGAKDKNTLLKCMLSTFKNSGTKFNSTIKIVIYDSNKEISLYDYKGIFDSI